MNIQLIGDKVLVEVEGNEERESGLVVPVALDSSSVRKGKVMAVGSGRDLEQGHVAMKTQVGDTVLFQYGVEVLIEGKKYILLTESGDIVGIELEHRNKD